MSGLRGSMIKFYRSSLRPLGLAAIEILPTGSSITLLSAHPASSGFGNLTLGRIGAWDMTPGILTISRTEHLVTSFTM